MPKNAKLEMSKYTLIIIIIIITTTIHNYPDTALQDSLPVFP